MAKILPSAEALNQEIIDELCHGRQFYSALEDVRERNSAQIAQDYKGKKSAGGLMHLGEIPQHEFFKMEQWQGKGCWEDRQFVKDFQRHNPHLFSHNV